MRIVARNWTPLIHATTLAIFAALLASVALLSAWNIVGWAAKALT